MVEVGKIYKLRDECDYPISGQVRVTQIITYPGIRIVGTDELGNECSMNLAMLEDCYEEESE